MAKALGYVRLSELTDSTTSPERQREAIEQLAAAKGLELVGTLEDIDLSGYSEKARPGRLELLSRLDEVDAVIVWKLDRLGRRVSTLLADVEEMQRHGVSLHSVSEGLDFSGAVGKLLLTMLGAVAEMESANISARTISSQLHLKKVGRWRGGRVPYGWQAVEHPSGDGYFLALNEGEAAVLLELVERVLDGASVAALTKELQELEVPPPSTSKRWHQSSVRKMLASPRLIGDSDSEPLISVDLYRRLQAELEGRTKERPTRQKRAHLLSGLLTCGSCGHPLHVSTKTGGQLVAKCFYTPVGNEPCSARVSITYEPLEEFVTEAFLKLVGKAHVVEVSELAADPNRERRERASVLLDQLTEQLATGAISLEVFTKASQRLQEDLALPESEAQTIVNETGERYEERWEREDTEGRRRVLSAALEAVVIDRGRGPVSERARLVWRS